MVKLPNAKCVLIYNKYQKVAKREAAKKILERDGNVIKLLAIVHEKNLICFFNF